MAENITLTNLVNLTNQTTAVNAINSNNAIITSAFQDVLSRSGVAPNQMTAALDMNSNRLINLPAPISVDEPMRVVDVNGLIGGGSITFNSIPTGGTVGQVLEKNSSTNYDVSWQNPPTGKFGTYINILNFGGDPTGASDNATAFNNAWATLATTGGTIYFPAGTYLFNAQFAKTFPSTQFGVSLVGDGPMATILKWPNSNGGLQFTNTSAVGYINIEGFTMVTSQSNSGIAINLIGNQTTQIGNMPYSNITNVDIHGDDLNGGTGVHFWNTGVLCNCWNCVNVYSLNTWGLPGVPGTSGGGFGMQVQGNSTNGIYGVIYNVKSSSFNFHTIGFVYGGPQGFVQGVTIDACNFNGACGSGGIQVSGPGILSECAISNCQFNYAGNQIVLSGALDAAITNNTITSFSPNGIGIDIIGGLYFTIVDNFFNCTNGNTGVFGLATTGSQGVVTGNVFALATGSTLQSASSNWNVFGNSYYAPSNTNQVINTGTNNTVGVITK